MKSPLFSAIFAKAARKLGLRQNVSGSLASILQPQAAYRWLLPQLAAITPQYIEMTLRGALAGNHVQAWELFDLMEDTWPHLGHCAQQIKRAVAKRLPEITAYSEEEEEPTESALERSAICSAGWKALKPQPDTDENGARGTIFDLLDAWLKCTAVLETDWQSTSTPRLGSFIAPRATRWVHPVCYAWSMEGRLGLRTDVQGRLSPGMISTTSYQSRPSTVAEFTPDKFLIGIYKAKSGSPLGGALLRPLAWWWCAANFSADWLLNLAQLFGLPFRLATYDPQASPDVVANINGMLQNMGSNAWGSFPTGTDIKLLESTGRATFSPQADMMDRADKACSLLLLGQTLTGDTGGGGKGGGSLALGQVHEGVKEDIVEAAAQYVADIVGRQLFPSILRLNYGDDSECPAFALVSKKEEDLEKKATVVKTLVDAGAGEAIPRNWVNKKFDIPIPQAGEPTLKKETPPPVDTGKPGDPGSEIEDDDTVDDDDDEVAPAKAKAALQAILAKDNDAEFQAALNQWASKL